MNMKMRTDKRLHAYQKMQNVETFKYVNTTCYCENNDQKCAYAQEKPSSPVGIVALIVYVSGFHALAGCFAFHAFF